MSHKIMLLPMCREAVRRLSKLFYQEPEEVKAEGGQSILACHKVTLHCTKRCHAWHWRTSLPQSRPLS
eukprot:616728-Pelagomonas_calceolata.AAC.6